VIGTDELLLVFKQSQDNTARAMLHICISGSL
jgi:hypothetical protein